MAKCLPRGDEAGLLHKATVPNNIPKSREEKDAHDGVGANKSRM